MVNSNRKDWKALARKAANEQDPKKLLSIVEELNKALEERENQLRGRVSKRIATKREGGNELLLVDDEPSIRLTLLPILAGARISSAGLSVNDGSHIRQ